MKLFFPYLSPPKWATCFFLQLALIGCCGFAALPRAKAQGGCGSLTLSLTPIDDCCYRLSFVNTSECFNNLQVVLDGGVFQSYSANSNAGWSVQTLGTNWLQLNTTFPFLPIGTSFPLIFCLKPGSNNPVLNISYEYNCLPGESCISSLSMEICPDPFNGSISGTKYRTCVPAPFNGSQEVVPNWTIYLGNQTTGELIDSTVTDAEGQYAFYDLPLGLYWVKEQPVPDWTPVFPASGEHIIALEPSQQTIANFGNCPPVNCTAGFNFNVVCNQVQFSNTSSSVSGGYTSVWNFGDNSPNSTQNSPSHLFTSTGNYNVCLTITAPNLCSKTICKTVTISTLGAPPTVVCPPSFTVNLPPNTCDMAVTLPPAQFTHSPCATNILDKCERQPNTIPLNALFPKGVNSILCTASDNLGTANCLYSVTVKDITPPQIQCPPNITVQGNPLFSGAQVSIPPPALLSDNCPMVQYKADPPNGIFPCGSDNILLYTATDMSGNTATCTTNVSVICPPEETDTCCAYSMYLSNEYTDGRVKKIRVLGVCGTEICCADPEEWAQESNLPLSLVWYPETGTPVPNGNTLDNSLLIYLKNPSGNNQILVEWLGANDQVLARHQIDIPCDIEHADDNDWMTHTSSVGLNDPNLFCFLIRETAEDEVSPCDPSELEVKECDFQDNIFCIDNSTYSVNLTGPGGYDVYQWNVVDGPDYPALPGVQSTGFTTQKAGSYVVNFIGQNTKTGEVCTGTREFSLVVFDPDFKWKYVPCTQGLGVEFTSSHATNSFAVSSIFWSCSPTQAQFPSTGDVVSHVFTAPGIYIVTMKINTIWGCEQYVSHEIEVKTGCNPNFEVASYKFCKTDCPGGVMPVTVTLRNTSSGGFCPTKYEWKANNGQGPVIPNSNENQEFITFTALVDCQNGNASYPIELTMSDPGDPFFGTGACSSTITKNISIVPCEVDFTYTVCPDGRVNLESDKFGKWDIPGNIGIAPWPYSGIGIFNFYKKLTVRYPPGAHLIKFTGKCDEGGECEIIKKIIVPDACCAKNDRTFGSLTFNTLGQNYRIKARMSQNQYPIFVHNIRGSTRLQRKIILIGNRGIWRSDGQHELTVELDGQVFKRDPATKCNCVVPATVDETKSATARVVRATEKMNFARFRSMKGSVISTHKAKLGSNIYFLNLDLGDDCDKFQWWFDWF